MGVVKSPGKRTPKKTAHTPQANDVDDAHNKDIYFEKDFGDVKDKARTSLYKDHYMVTDPAHETHELDKKNIFNK